MIASIVTNPTIPTVFFNKSEALITVSVTSANTFPTTGIKLLVTNFAVLIATPSVTAVVIPCTLRTPRKIVKKTPSTPTAIFLINAASFVTWSSSLIILTILRIVETRIRGNTK